MDNKTGAELIAAERARQMEKEGWSEAHDDEHDDRELALAAVSYVSHATQRAWLVATFPENGLEQYQGDEAPDEWPWAPPYWKPKDPIRDLVRAGALIAAEIDRLQRLQGDSNGQ